jgi:ankyrin repeat protein
LTHGNKRAPVILAFKTVLNKEKITVPNRLDYAFVSKKIFDDRYELLAKFIAQNRDKSSEVIYQEFSEKYPADANLFIQFDGIDSNRELLTHDFKKIFFHQAAMDGDIALIKFLQETGHDINHRDYQGRTPLLALVESNRVDKADDSFEVDDAEAEAIDNDDTTVANIAEKLIEYGADVNLAMGEERLTAVHLAVIHRKKYLLEKMIQSGKADLKRVDVDGNTVLHLVAEYRSKEEQVHDVGNMHVEKEIAELLMHHMDAINQQNKQGNTPVHIVARNGNHIALEAFLKKDYLFPQTEVLAIKNHQGNTVIHESVLGNVGQGLEILKLLIQVVTEVQLNIKSGFPVNGIINGDTALEIIDKSIENAANLVKYFSNKKENFLEKQILRSSFKEKLRASVSHLGGTLNDLQIQLLQGLLPDLKAHQVELQALHRKAAMVWDDTRKDQTGNINLLQQAAKDLAVQAREFVDRQNQAPWMETLGKAVDELDSQAHLFKTDIKRLASALQDAIQRLRGPLEYSGFFYERAQELLREIELLHREALEGGDEVLSHLESNAKYLTGKVQKCLEDAKKFFFDGSYGANLHEAKQLILQLDLLSWKDQQLQLPTSFPDLEIIDTQSPEYLRDMEAASIYWNNALHILKNSPRLARDNIKQTIPLYDKWQQYGYLEKAYQVLAKTYIYSYESANRYEAANLDHTHWPSTDKRKLHAHFALAGFYKVLKEIRLQQPRILAFSSLSDQALTTRESYHYSQAYQLTQGNLDNEAHVVLQRELGVATDTIKLATSNVRQCVVAIAHDPISKKLVLSHFDQFSGPLSFMDQILNEFPDRIAGTPSTPKIDLYLIGGRDRSPSNVAISDTNIHQVFKQFYAHRDKFTIRSTDVGDKPAPMAVVFDANAVGPKLIHAVPHRPDESIHSRAARMLIQLVDKQKDLKYLFPLNEVNFSQSEASRKVVFTPVEQQKLEEQHAYWKNLYDNNPDRATAAWQHDQVLYPLMATLQELAEGTVEVNQRLLTGYAPELRLVYEDIRDIDEFEPPARKRICLANRRKRDTGICSLDWETLDKFNLEKKEPRNEDKIVLDSSKILEQLQMLDKAKQIEFLQSVRDFPCEGKKADRVKVNKLIYMAGKASYMGMLSRISSGISNGLMAENVFADLAQGHYKSVVSNIVFVGTSYGSGSLSQFMVKQGERLQLSGRSFLGQAFKTSGPFLKRIPFGVIFYDLVQQVKALQTGDQEAIPGVVGDSLLLGVDLVEAGIEIAELTGIIAGVSTVAGPIGAAIGDLVMLGMQIYHAVRTVNREDKLIHLSWGEKFTEGFRAFVGIEPEAAIQKAMDLVERYKDVLADKLKFSKDHPEIKYVIFPAIEELRANCRSVVRRPAIGEGSLGGLPAPGSSLKSLQCDVLFESIPDNRVDLQAKQFNFSLDRAKPLNPDPASSTFLCLPSGQDEPVSQEGAYQCDAALGLTNHNSTGNLAFFDLGSGIDSIKGFLNTPNLFKIGEGRKYYEGGREADIFLVNVEKLPEGVLQGGEGDDTIVLSASPSISNQAIRVDLHKKYLRMESKMLVISDIEKLLGSPWQNEVVIVDCSTSVVDTQGGPTVSHHDRITIPHQDCHYDIKLFLKPHTTVDNKATKGTFHYLVQPEVEEGVISVGLLSRDTSRHQFIINATMSDVSAIDLRWTKEGYQLKLNFTVPYFKEASYSTWEVNAAVGNQSVGNTAFYFKDGIELKVGEKNSYLFYNSDREPQDLITTYMSKARDLNITGVMYALNNEVVVIGHTQHEVMHYDRLASKIHFVGNGGENHIIVDLSASRLPHFPLSEIVLYHLDGDAHIDTLDLRMLTAQLKSELNVTTEIKFIPPTEENKAGSDVVLLLAVKPSYQTSLLPLQVILPIRLKNALNNDWYKNALQIMHHVAPSKIVGSLTDLHLEPLPLAFNGGHKIIEIKASDVEPNTTLILPTRFNHDFFQVGDDLIVTDAVRHVSQLSLPTKYAIPHSIILQNYYQEPTLSTLTLKFFRENITLQQHLTKINAALDLNKTWNETWRTLLSNRLNTAYNASVMQHRQQYDIFYIDGLPSRKEYLISSTAAKASGILPALVDFLSSVCCGFFARKKVKKQVPVNYLLTQERKKGMQYSYLNKQAMCGLQTTALSTRVISPTSAWVRLLIEICTGFFIGYVGERLDSWFERYPNRFISLQTGKIFFEAWISTFMTGLRYFLFSAQPEWEFSGVSLHLAYNLCLVASSHSALMVLEQSKIPGCKQLKHCIQALQQIFFLQTMYSYFTLSSDHSLLYHMSAIATARIATRQARKSRLFNLNAIRQNLAEEAQDEVQEKSTRAAMQKISSVFLP